MKSTKKIGMMALFESQSYDNDFHQNLQLLICFCSLIIVFRFLNEFLAECD